MRLPSPKTCLGSFVKVSIPVKFIIPCFLLQSHINRICTAVVIFCVLSTYVHSLVKYLTRTDKSAVYK